MRSRWEAPAGHPKAPRASTTPARRVREEALEERPDDAPVVVGADRERRRPAPGAARPSRLDAPERRVDARARLRVRGRARRARPRAAGAAGDGVAECGGAGVAAARQPRRRFRGVAAARHGRKHAMQSAAGRARSGFRRVPRQSGGAHVPIASVVLSPPVSSCRRRSGTTALRQALPTRSRPPPRKVTDAAAGAQPQLPASGFIQGEPPGRILERTAPFSWEATEPKSSKDVAPLRHR